MRATGAPDASWDSFRLDGLRCPFDGQAFDCIVIEDTNDHAGTQVHSMVELVGEWSGAEAFAGDWIASTTCSGDGCSAFEACEAQHAFEAHLQE